MPPTKPIARMTAEERAAERTRLFDANERLMAERAKAEERFKTEQARNRTRLDQLAAVERFGELSPTELSNLRAALGESTTEAPEGEED